MYVEFWSGWCTQLAYLSDKSKCTNMGSWTKNIWKMLSMITRISYMMITTIIAWKLWSMHDEKRSHYDVFYTLWNISGRRPWKNEAKGVILSEKFHRIWNTSYYMYSLTLLWSLITFMVWSWWSCTKFLCSWIIFFLHTLWGTPRWRTPLIIYQGRSDPYQFAPRLLDVTLYCYKLVSCPTRLSYFNIPRT